MTPAALGTVPQHGEPCHITTRALTCPSPAVGETGQVRGPLTQLLGVPWFPQAPDGAGALPQ